MTYHIGQTLPYTRNRGPLGREIDPLWLALSTAPQQEFKAAGFFARMNIPEVWLPTITDYRRAPNGGPKIEVEKPSIARYFFILTDRELNWDIIKDRMHGKLVGVPIPLRERDISQMAQVPQRIAAMREAERLEREINPGDWAMMTGAIELNVWVEAVKGDRVHFLVPMLGWAKGEASLKSLQKIPTPEIARTA